MKKLLLAGAGHAHLMTIMNMDRLVRAGYSVTVVGPGDYHYYSGMGPGLLSGLYQLSETRFHVRRMVEERGGKFITGSIAHIQADQNRVELTDHRFIDYDVLSCNLGSEVVPVAAKDANIVSVKPIENLYTAGREIERRLKNGRLHVLVIGGGAAGIELAGNLFHLGKKTKGNIEITVVSGGEILTRFDPRMRPSVLATFAQRNIRVIEHASVAQLSVGEVLLDNGLTLPFDFAFNASGIRPSPVFRNSNLPVGNDGGLLVNEFLQCINHPRIFGGGDCISFTRKSLDRVGVYAVRQGPVLYKNILAALACGELHVFKPQARYLSILNIGDGLGLLSWRSHVLTGHFAFLLKNYIDKMFMRRFQVSGEQKVVVQGV